MNNLAKAMFEAYTKSSGNKNYQGKEIPKWEDLPEAIRKHWKAAANAGYRHVRDKMIGGPLS